MQFRFPTELTAEEYVRTETWKNITVVQCLIHPDSACRLSKHGTYPRKIPDGTKIVRFLCHTENITFSLLPDCFASRLPGTLVDVEAAVFMVETALACESGCDVPESMENSLISSLDLSSAAEKTGVDQRLFDKAADFRWLKRRIQYVLCVLSTVISLFPETFGNHRPTLTSFRSLHTGAPILIRLRISTESRIHEIPLPVGLNPRFSITHDMVCRPP